MNLWMSGYVSDLMWDACSVYDMCQRLENLNWLHFIGSVCDDTDFDLMNDMKKILIDVQDL